MLPCLEAEIGSNILQNRQKFVEQMSNLLFDPVRGQHVEKTPEEIVRQRLLQYLSKVCGIPLSLIAVEKCLHEMPHLSHVKPSQVRRTDIVCYAHDFHPHHNLYPLILAECKAKTITPLAVEQALGYNTQIGAPYVLLASADELRLYLPRLENDPLHFLPHLLPYEELVQRAKSFYA